MDVPFRVMCDVTNVGYVVMTVHTCVLPQDFTGAMWSERDV